jgi:hypothetical protein
MIRPTPQSDSSRSATHQRGLIDRARLPSPPPDGALVRRVASALPAHPDAPWRKAPSAMHDVSRNGLLAPGRSGAGGPRLRGRARSQSRRPSGPVRHWGTPCTLTQNVTMPHPQAWTGWINVGGDVGNPCPPGCERGAELGQSFRAVGFPPRPQVKHKFQCWR